MLELYISVAIAALLFGLLFYQQFAERRKSRNRWHRLMHLRRESRERERMQSPVVKAPVPPQHLPSDTVDASKN
jgi:hypothetical protein